MKRERKFTGIAIRKDFFLNWSLYLMALPLIAFYIIFHYLPMSGVALAFVDYKPKLGIFASPFVGLEHFQSFFHSIYIHRTIRNTIAISLLEIIVTFPVTILFALMLNEIQKRWFKRALQTLSYLPYFISMVVAAGIIIDMVSSRGAISQLMAAITGGNPENLLGKNAAWRPIYILSGLWQGMGFGSIIYIAALAGVDQELYEAAVMDGAGRWRQMWHVTLPGISSTIVIMLILKVGSIMAVGYEKTILLYNPQIYESADIISSYVYRKGLQDFDYSYASAVGLFNSVVSLILLTGANFVSKRLTETSLF